MERLFSLALHDVRVSWSEKAVEIIANVMEQFEVPLTVHLIFDQPLRENSALANFILENIANNKLEIVFHGINHECSKKVSKLWAFYHKYQAEYLDDNNELRQNTAKIFESTANLLKTNLGICPPCWIAIKKNFQFLKSLSPLYTESLLALSNKDGRRFSSVISVGSPNSSEIFFLKILAKFIFYLSFLSLHKRIRVAIHICDLENAKSLSFFQNIVSELQKYRHRAALLNELAN